MIRALTVARLRAWVDGSAADYFSLILLASVVAPREPAVREELARARDALARRDAGIRESLRRRWGRVPVDGLDVQGLTRAMNALVEGLVLDARAAGVDEDLATAAMTGLMRGLTRPAGRDPDELDRLGDDPTPLGTEERRTVERAVTQLYDREGWSGVTLGRVAEVADVPVSRVAATFGHRDGLATVVWERLVRSVLRMGELRGAATAVQRLELVLHQLAEQVVGHRAVTSSLVMDQQRRLQAVDWSVADEMHTPLRQVVELVGEVLASDPARFRGAEDPDRVDALAQHLVSSVLIVSLSGRDRESGHSVDLVLQMCLDGILARRRPSGREVGA